MSARVAEHLVDLAELLAVGADDGPAALDEQPGGGIGRSDRLAADAPDRALRVDVVRLGERAEDRDVAGDARRRQRARAAGAPSPATRRSRSAARDPEAEGDAAGTCAGLSGAQERAALEVVARAQAQLAVEVAPVRRQRGRRAGPAGGERRRLLGLGLSARLVESTSRRLAQIRSSSIRRAAARAPRGRRRRRRCDVKRSASPTRPGFAGPSSAAARGRAARVVERRRVARPPSRRAVVRSIGVHWSTSLIAASA